MYEGNFTNAMEGKQMRRTMAEKGKQEKIKIMEEELEMVAPAMIDVCKKIADEKPDKVVFLDKSARIFALPMRKFLQENCLGGDKAVPDFNFFNDSPLKNGLEKLGRNNDFSRAIRPEEILLIDKELSWLSGKKVVIVDETFAFGRGVKIFMDAVRIINTMAERNSNQEAKTSVHFFALSYTRSTGGLSTEGYKEACEYLAQQIPGFELTIYENEKSHLFSRHDAFRTVDDETFNDKGQASESINEKLKYLEAEGVSHDDPWYAAAKERNLDIFELKKIANQRIYEKMVEVNGQI